MATMGTAAEFLAERFDRDYPHLLAVLVAKKSQCALGHGVLNAHDFRSHRFVLANFAVDDGFNLINVARCEGTKMSEIEPEAIRRDERAILLDVRSQHVAQGRMHEMGRRVISGRILPSRPVYRHVQPLAFSDTSLADRP